MPAERTACDTAAGGGSTQAHRMVQGTAAAAVDRRVHLVMRYSQVLLRTGWHGGPCCGMGALSGLAPAVSPKRPRRRVAAWMAAGIAAPVPQLVLIAEVVVRLRPSSTTVRCGCCKSAPEPAPSPICAQGVMAGPRGRSIASRLVL